jgi:hypothetical protein
MWKRSLFFLLIVAGLAVGCGPAEAPDSSSPTALQQPRSPVVTVHSLEAPEPTATTGEVPTFRSPWTPVSPTMKLQPNQSPSASVLGSDRAVSQAITDLAERLGVEPNGVEVIRVSTDEFPSQNLGCPSLGDKTPSPVQPAFVTGWEIVLAADGQEYLYRAHAGVVVFCREMP